MVISEINNNELSGILRKSEPILMMMLLCFFCVFAACLPQNFAQSKVCASCGKAIDNSAVMAEGKYYHPEHFICAVCKKVLQDGYVKHNSQLMHKACYQQMNNLICRHCNKPLEAEYIRYENGLYHQECFAKNVQKKCAICNKGLSGYYLQNEYGDNYHEQHKNEYEQCFSCSRLLAPGIAALSRSYRDGRKICSSCTSELMPLETEFVSIMTTVSRRLRDLGLTVSLQNISIQGVDRNVLKSKMAQGYSDEARGFCHSTKNTQTLNGKTVSESIQHTIYVLNGLPLTLTESIIAHELMHAWIFENSKVSLTDKQTEGSCNLVSWNYLKSRGTADAERTAKRIEENDDPIYGDGFRVMRANYGNLSQLIKAISGKSR